MFLSMRHGGGLSLWVQAAAASVVFWWCGWLFIGRWWRSLVERDPNMFTLIVTGTGAAWIYSAGVVLGGGDGPVYFETAAVVTALVLLGQILEQRAHARTGEALRGLMELRPATARRVLADGREETVAAGDVAVGDLLRICPGERVPADGVVESGAGDVDESMLTGEPAPAVKRAGDMVSAGTLNLATGGFLERVTGTGEATLLAQIIRLVREAQESEAPAQRVADRVAGVFAPVVFAVASAAFAAWWIWSGEVSRALLYGIATLVVACPCALGLATPLAVVTGVGRGAREGILVKSAAALERLAAARTVLVDKTGTLTLGRPRVSGVFPEAGAGAEELLGLAAAAEAGSGHPLAVAIVEEARRRGLAVAAAADFRAEPGAGVRAVVGGRQVVVGRAADADGTGAFGAATLAEVSVDGKRLGIIALEDEVRGDAERAAGELKKLGARVVIVSGDREACVASVAGRLGIDEWYAGVSPVGKMELVKKFRSTGCVVFAGDGLNDAPALAAADVGVAMGTGAAVALDSASVVLMSGGVGGLSKTLRLGKVVLRNIKQNLFWAFFYNGLGVPVAAGVLVPLTGWAMSPMLAGAAMSFSCLCVVGNALRLKRVRL
jgi:Cu+-exporting ATPase